MEPDLLVVNAVHWFAQALLLAGVVGLTLAILRVTDARLRLAAWHAVLLASLVLPIVTPWKILEPTDTVAVVAPAGWSVPWGSLLVAVVLSGVGLRLIWLAAGVSRLGALRRRATPWQPVWLESLARRIGASAALGASAEIRSAVTFGFRQPAILVPDALTRAAEPQQRAVVAHELWHVARRDWIWLLYEEGVRTLLWWHPAIWAAVAEARQAREEIVDRKAIDAVGDRESYLEALVAAAEQRGAGLAGFVPHFYRRHQLKTRVQRLLKEKDMSPMRLLACAAVIAVAVPATVWAGGSAFPLAGAGPEVVQQDPPPPPPPPPQRVTKKSATWEQLPPPPPPPPPRKVKSSKPTLMLMPPPPPPAPQKKQRADAELPAPMPKLVPKISKKDAPPPPPMPKDQKLVPKIIRKDAPRDGKPVVKDEKLAPKVVKKGGGGV